MTNRNPVLNGYISSLEHHADKVVVVIEFFGLRACCSDMVAALGLAMETGTAVDLHHAE